MTFQCLTTDLHLSGTTDFLLELSYLPKQDAIALLTKSLTEALSALAIHLYARV